MKNIISTLALAAAVSVVSFPVFAQVAADGQMGSNYAGSVGGSREAMKMVPATAGLLRSIDARKDQPNAMFEARLREKVKLSDGTMLPEGTILKGMVAEDDMQNQGKSKLALVFGQAQLKDGKMVPIKATIVGFFAPGSRPSTLNDDSGDNIPNSWSDGTLTVNEMGPISGVDLHSTIASKNSGVFVSTKKDDIKLASRSEFQLAIAPANVNTASNM
jgi:hypothetical protein